MAAVQLNEAQFWQSIAILIRNYHALNKKIFEVLITQVQKVQLGKLCESNESELEQQMLQSTGNGRICEGFRITYKMLTKKLSSNILANGIVDFINQSYECRFIENVDFDDFIVKLNNGQLEVTPPPGTECVQSSRWTQFVLKPKLCSWAHSRPDKNVQKSLRLLDVEMYCELYKKLKQKHAESLLDYWQTANESTDPLKFIYEDLAIAAYLITLWHCTQPPTAFADLGCGNGLLVHVLNAEGYKGYGYDVRRRKLWSLYPEPTISHLIEQTVDPKSFRLDYPDIDWLIGNHSDELSPWVPVLAARLNTSFFLLPCCPFELSGAKFQRRNTGISAYQDFMLYAYQLSDLCGFETQQDRLKIPSTKRLSLIGLKHTAKPVQDLEYLVQQELQKHKVGDQLMVNTVKLREKTESVKNCTQVDKSIIDALVLKIFNMLLPNTMTTNENDVDNSWLPGQQLTMRDIAQGLTKSELTGIKSECGGIKTLLRNKHEVFEFCGNDRIGIRKPKAAVERNEKMLTVKKRPCFFKFNHPQGCPLDDDECSFIH